ncbi:MAG: nicotinate-nucleotide adenylyltransferase [Desulfoarculaceae bacterium]|nr:nicotinate-nucleotide adenylyltransferase [Desulfoarculaceae bacterium]
MNPRVERIGLLGGTFDPVHQGHLQIAEIARSFCELQEVRFVPASVPPHKNRKVVASFSHRANMIQLALASSPSFRLSTIEASLPEPSYTIDTLRYLHSHAAMPTDFFFIIGADAFLDITTWKLYRQVLQTAHLVVMDRAGCTSSEMKNLMERLGYEVEDSLRIWHHPGHRRKIFFPPMAVVAISSSRIRQSVKANRPIEGLVPAAVLDYIQAHGLYA